MYVYETILADINNVLAEINTSKETEYEQDSLALPISFEYLVDLFTGDTTVDAKTVEYVVAKIFVHYMEDYNYESGSFIPAIPVIYIMVRIRQYREMLAKHMALASEEAEWRYTATMN